MKYNSALSRFSLLLVFLLPLLLGSSNHLLQEDDRFYLSNYTNFSPGSTVTINLYYYGKGAEGFYDLRLLKIDDPAAFFTSAGTENLRGSFDIWGENKDNLLRFTKIIREWKEEISTPRKFGYRNNLNVGKINEPGIYIVQARRGNQVAYCAIVVSDLAMVYKNSPNQVIAFAANAKTSEFIKNVKFSLYSKDGILQQKISDKDGLVNFDISKPVQFDGNQALLIAQTGKETIICDPYFYFNPHKNLTAYIYTNQPVYRPRQHVNFKAIFREKDGNEILNLPGENFEALIKSPKNKEVYSANLTTNQFGSLSGSFILDEEADLGVYNIELSSGDQKFFGSFSVEEYKKPDYFVSVKTEKDQYAGKDIIKGEITADYYFGSPVKNAEVTLNIFQNNYWRPWWYWSDYAWFYRSFSSSKLIYRPEPKLIHQLKGELNEEGKFLFEYEVDAETDFDYVYNISAEVTDYSRRAVNGSKDVFVTRGSFTLSTSTDKYFYSKNKPINILVNAVDFSDQPVAAKFKIAIGFRDYSGKNQNNFSVYDTLYGSTDVSGKALINFIPPSSRTGYYNYIVFSYDEKGREISASGSFFVGNDNEYWNYRQNNDLEIITDKDAYFKGDTLTAHIFLPEESTDLLITFETSKILSWKKYSVKEKSFTIKQILTEEFSPGFNISITYVKNGQFNSSTKMIGVLAMDKFLNISIHRSKDEYKPGEDAEYTIRVKNSKGIPVRNAELSIGIVDESVYAIQQDYTTSIQSFFYAPAYNYIPVRSSLQRHSFNGGSRRITYADKDFSQDVQSGEESLQGKIKFKNGDAAAHISIIITNDFGYYTTQSDLSGNYKIEKIKKGRYDVLAASANTELSFVENISISGKTEFDFEVPTAMNVLASDIEVGGTAEFDLNAAPRSKMNSGIMLTKAAGENYVQAEIRSNFVDASIWNAHLITDENGEAAVKFKMPDNLTTWRATVKGITRQSDVGEKTDKVITRKNLLVRMEVPRFFREEDEITISTIVHNYLNEKKKTKISFNSGNLELLDSQINTPGYSTILFDKEERMYEINIEKNSEVRIDWIIKIIDPVGEAKLIAEALTNEESDAVQLVVPILPKGYKEIKTLNADFTNNNIKEELKFNIPADVDLRTAELSINLSPSLAGTVLKALDDLVVYPYGCVEQTMSRFLPAIIAANTFRELNAPLKAVTIQKLPEVVDAGLKRLYNFQHADGGWGWWENDDTNPYMSAYVVYGLSLAKSAGYSVNDEVFQNGIKKIKDLINQNDKKDITTLSFMIYAVSTAAANGYTDYDSHQIINELANDELDSYSTALMLIASENLKGESSAKIFADKLLMQVNEEEDYAFWGGKQFNYRWQDDNVQSTAFAVKALIENGNNTDLINKAVKWLLIHKNGFSWKSTQETASVIFALTDYLKQGNELEPDFIATVYVNDKKAASKTFTREDIFNGSKSIKISNINDEILKSGNNSIRIEKNGKGKLYFSALAEYYSRNETAAAKVNRFEINRDYFVLKPVLRDKRIIYVKEKFNGVVKSGDNLLVKTLVETSDNNLQYFILEDMLPSGFEVVKDENQFTIEGENNYDNFPRPLSYTWRWFYADREYRDEKTAFFVTNVYPQMEFSYIIKAQMPGKFTAMPAQGYLMYFPEVSGSSDMAEFEVRE